MRLAWKLCQEAAVTTRDNVRCYSLEFNRQDKVLNRTWQATLRRWPAANRRGLVAAQRIADMRKEFDINIENAYLIVNRLRSEMPVELKSFTDKLDVPLLGTIPADDALSTFEFSGKPLVDLGDDSPVYQSVAQMLKTIL